MKPRKGRQPGPWPGHLDLRASLSQADATAVWRYLPRSIAQPVRHYVREAVRQGRSRQVQFEVRGPLHEFPFAPAATPGRGAAATGAGEALFRIQAELEDVGLRYLPHALLPPGTLPLAWPDLQALAGTLVFEGQQMRLQVRQGRLQAAPQVRVLEGQARIDDLTQAHLQVQAQAQGPLQAQLDVLASTPAARMTGHVLDTLQGDGAARLELRLDIPLEAAATRAGAQPSVQGRVHLQGNQLRWWPQVPQLQQVQGSVQFTHQGFAAQDLQAQALGGPLRLSLASQPQQPGQPFRTRIEAQGQLSADGLRQYAAQALGQGAAQPWLAPLHGQSSYQLQVQTVGERAYIDLSSDLQGLGSHLPAPLDKPAASAEPLRLWHTPAAQAQGEESLQLQWGQRLYARYRLAAPSSAAETASAPTRSSAPRQSSAPAAEAAQPTGQASASPTSTSSANAWRVLGGEVLIGAFSADERRLAAFIPNSFAPAPITPRVRATIAWPQWNASAWLPWLHALAQPQAAPASAPPGPDAAATVPSASSAPSAPPAWQAFVPDVWYAKLARLQLGAVGFDAVQAQIYRSEGERRHWVARLKARQARGTLEYHPDYLDGTGLLRGKVAYLELPATLAEPSEGEPDAPQTAQQPSSAMPSWADVTHLPTVDLEIERLLFAQRDWGRVALQAVNQVQAGAPSEWRINYLTVHTPQARLTAKGSWRDAKRQGQPSALLSGRKRMDMRFTLEMFDAGGLLARLGMPDVLQGGQGQLDGRLSWSGSPLKLDLPSLGGALHLQVRRGQFLQASAGAARLLGVLSLQALPRRLSLDFRDVFSSGFAFDLIQGDVRLEGGQARTNNLQMKGVNAGVLLEGVADLVAETQDIQVVVVPELDAMTASLVATAINPAVGAGTLLAQFFLSKPLAESAARQFHIHGTWSEPQVERLARPAAAQ
ncbi:MAG: AsmA-like C-terminal region-containing protein, partial [Comamonadaceae bacterium]|nr:AsmA-like C-terminal region-containing protein [Comamonadaceae bacterium]